MILRWKGFTLVSALLLFTVLQARSFAADSTVTSGDIDKVFNSLRKNEWKNVEALTADLLQRSSPGQRFLIGRLRYIYIYSIAAQLEKKAVKFQDAAKKLGPLQGQLIVQPWHPVDPMGKSCFNKICTDSENKRGLFSAQTNNDGTVIYSFEYFDMGSPVDLTSFKGENARCGGVLRKIDINENIEKAGKTNSGVTWFLRLHVTDGFIDFER